MAQIHLSITAETPEELYQQIRGLAGIIGGEAPEAPITARTVLAEIKSEQAPEADAPKRGRGRPRKPLETPEEAAAADPATNPITPEEAKDAAPVATVGALPPTEPQPEPPTETKAAPSVTIDNVREALKVLVNAKGGDAARAVLRDQGFEKLSDVPEQMYGDVIAKAQAASK